MRERNEALDCRVYARAAAWIMGADRWDEATWRRLEEQAGVNEARQDCFSRRNQRKSQVIRSGEAEGRPPE